MRMRMRACVRSKFTMHMHMQPYFHHICIHVHAIHPFQINADVRMRILM